MARRFIKRYLPDAGTIRDHKHLKFFGRLLHDPNLLHLNRYSVSKAFAIGLFWAFVPMPLQTIPAAATAIILRANLIVSVALVWITNPFTLVPIYYFCYWIGALILGTPVQELPMETSWDWVISELAIVWQPFLLGALIVSATTAVLGYYGIRLLWRWHVMRDWERRRQQRQQKVR